MARKELALDLSPLVPQYQTTPEQWRALWANPAFLQCLTEIKVAYLKALRSVPSSDAEKDEHELWRSRGLEDALKAIELADSKSVKADNG